MLSFLAPYKLLIEIAVVGALFTGAAYGVHRFLEYERDIGRNEVRQEYAVKLAEAKDAAAKEQARLTKQLEDAQNAAVEREKVLRTTATAAATASASLRGTLDSIRAGVPTATVDALRNATVALTAVFGDCQDKYRGLAETADRHASDVKTLSDAWPR